MEYVICFRCWETVEKTGRWQKFCKECGKIVNDVKNKHRMQRKRSLGTSDFFEHRCKNFGEEWCAVQGEKHRLRLFF